MSKEIKIILVLAVFEILLHCLEIIFDLYQAYGTMLN
jgi:hypothetical protein